MSESAADIEPRPAADEVRAALERILASEPFRPSAQLRVFLRYVVETTLRGEADRIRAFTIAVEAFGRDKDFNPQGDPIVRVEAARLRRAIEQYYAGPGADDTVEILVPRGGYVPQFRYRGRAVQPPAAPEVATVAPAPRQPRARAAAGRSRRPCCSCSPAPPSAARCCCAAADRTEVASITASTLSVPRAARARRCRSSRSIRSRRRSRPSRPRSR